MSTRGFNNTEHNFTRAGNKLKTDELKAVLCTELFALTNTIQFYETNLVLKEKLPSGWSLREPTVDNTFSEVVASDACEFLKLHSFPFSILFLSCRILTVCAERFRHVYFAIWCSSWTFCPNRVSATLTFESQNPPTYSLNHLRD